MTKYIIIFFVCIGIICQSVAQTPPDSSEAFLQFTVKEDVLSLQPKKAKRPQIYSASKSLEDYLSAPVSATVINQQMIEQSGALNIPEALRLVPGVWVTQKTNGNYEVFLRQNNTTTSGLLHDTKNTQLLVVIDHVPQYDYLFAGIIWETLPVTIHDIERIEVIKTPSGIFYGNAAIGGVVHIFTKQAQAQNLKFALQSQTGATAFNIQNGGGQDVSYLHQGSVSGGIGDKFRFRLSGHYYFLKRFQDDYYLLLENRLLPSDSLLTFKYNAFETNLNTKKAQERFGVNAFTSYAFSNKVVVHTRVSYQQTFAQTIQTDDTLALAQRTTNTLTANVNLFVDKLHVTASYQVGERDYAQGYAGNQFSLNHLQAMADYKFRFRKVDFQPGIGLLQSNHISNQVPTPSESFTNYYVFLKANLNPIPQLRVMASARGDVFAQSERPFLSYQLSSTYKISSHLIRGSYVYNEAPALFRRFRQNVQHTIVPDAAPNNASTIELGWSTKIQSRINASLSLFLNQGAYRYTAFTDSTTSARNVFNFAQAGLSSEVSVRWSKLEVRGFVTLQRSGQMLNDLSQDGFGSTPQFYGGLQLNYEGLLGRLNLNTQLYFYENYTIDTQYQALTIPAKTLLNFKLSYKVWKENSIFLNVRNALNSISPEFVFADQVPAFYLVGLQVAL
ncbi:hypothetical protein BKI52_24465 [marine bacterium AO1-C]|nr:hypothetical protein BKI52_24465 [marine bacterium AO1-C]